MAKQYRKLQEKIYKNPEQKKAPEQKIGKDYVLMAVTVFTVLVTCAGWTSLDNVSRAMYSLLSVSLRKARRAEADPRRTRQPHHHGPRRRPVLRLVVRAFHVVRRCGHAKTAYESRCGSSQRLFSCMKNRKMFFS